jgi:hypothetical protein
MGMPFLLGAAAQDLRVLIEVDLVRDGHCTHALLHLLLALDRESMDERQQASPVAIRRSQIQLATALRAREALGCSASPMVSPERRRNASNRSTRTWKVNRIRSTGS